MASPTVLNRPVPNAPSTGSTSTAQTLATAMRRLASIDPEQPSCFEDLVALNAARNCIDELFRACSEELRADPETNDLWEAMSFAVAVQSKLRPARNSKLDETQHPAGEQVELFWSAFADRFTWDFLPVDFLHALYAQWMGEQFPGAIQFSKTALTRRLKRASATSGNWFHTRARPGTLMNATEPLTARVPHWSHDGSEAAIYGLRRSGV